MTIKITVMASCLFIATLIGSSNIAVAREHAATKSELQPCMAHQRATKDCHIHDQNTYLHMRLSDAKDAGPHAIKEYRKLRRLQQQKLRD